MAEALRKKLLSTLMNTQSEEEKEKFIALSKGLFYTLQKHHSNISAHQAI